MPLDPQAQALLEQMKALGFVYSPELTVTRAREMVQAMLAVRPAGEPVAHVEDRLISGQTGEIPIRIYSPDGSGPFPLLVFLHTGGWMVGNLDSQDPLCRRITNRTGCIVVSIDYRLAPENPFPAAVEDSYEATQWIAIHAAEFHGDTSRIAIVGDSSGGNMAAVVALLARDRGGPKLAFQILMFPATDFRLGTQSMEDFGDGYNVTKAQMIWIRNNYLPNPADWTNPLASPLLAPDLSGLPPALIIYAEYDPLRDDAAAYAERLKEAGVPVKASRYDGMIHDFPDLFEEPGNHSLDEIASALRAAFN
ncbi:MAG TPA: alpha/beta hydrolase [Ktedonobacteraceae bacterium]|nr:alpha/beta hydrolase [Ktedonobacteraceae bacterium]